MPGDAHCLTFSCYRRQAFFPGRLAARRFLENVDAARSAESFDLWAYVIMSEHVHLVLLPAPGSRISRILRFAKKPFADAMIQWVRAHSPQFLAKMEHRDADGRVSHHFWQGGGGYDRNLRSVADVHEKIAYIHANPVRRGLVTDPGDWPWSSYRAWMSGDDDHIRLDRDTLPPLET